MATTNRLFTIYDLPDGILVEFEAVDVGRAKQWLLKHVRDYQLIWGLASVAIVAPQEACPYLKGLISTVQFGINTMNAVQNTIEIEVEYVHDSQDMIYLSETLKWSSADIISLHCNAIYTLDMYGFLPGFVYLSGNDPNLYIPRKSTPSKHVAPGSVAIAGAYTGVYPVASPGGWHVIGRTDFRFLNLDIDTHNALEIGSQIKFIDKNKIS